MTISEARKNIGNRVVWQYRFVEHIGVIKQVGKRHAYVLFDSGVEVVKPKELTLEVTQ